MTNQETAQHMHTEHAEWMAEMAYWHNELTYFSNVVLDLADKLNDPGEIEKLEWFKSKFDNMQDAFSDVKGRIAAHEKALTFETGTDGNTTLNMDHEQLRWTVKQFYDDFRNLKNDFYKFADKDCKY